MLVNVSNTSSFKFVNILLVLTMHGIILIYYYLKLLICIHKPIHYHSIICVSKTVKIYLIIYIFVCLFSKDALNWPKVIKILPIIIIHLVTLLNFLFQISILERFLKDHDTGEWSNDAEDSALPS